MNAIKPNMDVVKGLPKLDEKRFAKRSIKSVNDKIDKAAADRFGSNSGFIVADMMPVESEVRPLLYDGVTKEERGRYQYLKVSIYYHGHKLVVQSGNNNNINIMNIIISFSFIIIINIY